MLSSFILIPPLAGAQTCHNRSAWLEYADAVPGASLNGDPVDYSPSDEELVAYDWDYCGSHAYCLHCEKNDLTCNFFLKFYVWNCISLLNAFNDIDFWCTEGVADSIAAGEQPPNSLVAMRPPTLSQTKQQNA